MRDGAPHKIKSQSLVAQFGPLIGGQDLRRALGFRSRGAFRTALDRGHMPVKVFSLEGRRGKFAFAVEVEAWLRTLRAAAHADPHQDRDKTEERQ